MERSLESKLQGLKEHYETVKKLVPVDKRTRMAPFKRAQTAAENLKKEIHQNLVIDLNEEIYQRIIKPEPGNSNLPSQPKEAIKMQWSDVYGINSDGSYDYELLNRLEKELDSFLARLEDIELRDNRTAKGRAEHVLINGLAYICEDPTCYKNEASPDKVYHGSFVDFLEEHLSFFISDADEEMVQKYARTFYELRQKRKLRNL